MFLSRFIPHLEEMISHCFAYHDMGRFGDCTINNFVIMLLKTGRFAVRFKESERRLKLNMYFERVRILRFYHPYMWTQPEL